ncbi:acyl-CoA dehydrogenase family protein [Natrinema halophilum]|uniref:Acyl-CoA dehydrogenase family protein n=1 Tax=Natrinema halophilum TaxID=1699371 RepID=A0A7D5L387_9EURY|nr:acyl-CoA dehydrogenase family protein [Natrinema halophilum]QLG48185.1 acyl-CoA dehydrogenase family protein [Natrinema halophilum]
MELTEEQTAVRDVVREYARDEIRPATLEADSEQEFPEAVWDGLADLDLTGLTVPQKYGGYDADPVTAAVVNEEVAYGMLAVATALSVHSLATSCLAEFGSEEQQERWLPDMAEGRPVGAFALSEPHAGSNPAEMTTEARREGDEYVIDGEKQWITNGERAGVYILFAKTDRDDPSTVTQFLVPGDVDGLTVGEKEDKLGLRASDTTSLTFDGARIPAENRLTEEGSGLSAAFHILTGGRIAIAAQSVGLAQCAFDEARSYSQERDQFGGPIGDIQTIRHKLAEMATRIRAARLLTRDAARKRAAGGAALEASMAKYFASETAMFAANEAVQIHGGYGYVTEGEVERLYRDAKITEIYEGTTEIQKQVIARELLE